MWEKFPGPYDAVIASTTEDGKYYFFKGDQYARYTRDTGIDNDPVVGNPISSRYPGYPRSTLYTWPGLWTLGDYLGPALGPINPDGPTIWVWLKADTTVRLQSTTTGLSLVKKSSSPLTVRPPTDNSIASGPQLPGVIQVYTVSGLARGQRATITLSTDTFTLGSLSVYYKLDMNTAPNVSIVFGSCVDDARQSPRLNTIPSLEAIKTLNPDFMILTGDTTYYVNGEHTNQEFLTNYFTTHENIEPDDYTGTVNFDNNEGDLQDGWNMFMRHFTTRVHPSVASLMKKIPSISTWDDHDFGFNNSDRVNMTTSQRKMATDIFRLLWPNSYAMNTTNDAESTIEHTFRWGAVAVFIPDCRTFRDNSGHILGDAQLARLKLAMQNSDASVKILVCSTQLIQERPDGAGFYNEAPDERSALLSHLDSISGKVLILSGDVHYSELSWYGGQYYHHPKLVELTSSPLLVKYGTENLKTPSGTEDTHRVWSVKNNGFARINIDFSPGRDTPKITMECYGANGAIAKIYPEGEGKGVTWPNAKAVWDQFNALEQS